MGRARVILPSVMTRIALLSDSHDQVVRLGSVVKVLQGRGIGTAIHCGDITSPRAVEALSGLTVHWVFGNCDFDREGLRAAMAGCGHVCHGLRGELAMGGRRLAFTHGDRAQLLSALIASPGFDVVLHGHTHVRRDDLNNGVRVVCPGALAHAAPLGFAILELPTLDLEWIDLE